MKKVFSYVFKGWKISDYIIAALALLAEIALVVVSQVIKKPVEVAELYSLPHIISGFLLIPCVIFCLKDTIHGYVLGMAALAFFAWGIYGSESYGSFMGLLMLEIYLIYRLVMKCLNKEATFAGFGKWDFVFLICGLAVCAYPLYMLMDSTFVSNLISETLVVLCTLAFIFLSIKGIRYSKFLLIGMALLTSISLAMDLYQEMFENAGLAVGTLMILILGIVESIKVLINIKKAKEIE